MTLIVRKTLASIPRSSSAEIKGRSAKAKRRSVNAFPAQKEHFRRPQPQRTRFIESFSNVEDKRISFVGVGEPEKLLLRRTHGDPDPFLCVVNRKDPFVASETELKD